MKFSFSHDYNIPAEQLWKYLFDAELEASVKKATNLAEFGVTSRTEGKFTVRSVRVVPNLEVPGAIKKVLGDSVGYREEDRVPNDGATEYEWTSSPDALPGKITMGGRFKVESLGAARCRRTISGTVDVKIFGLGGLVEKFITGEMEKNYGLVAREQERWIKAKTAAA